MILQALKVYYDRKVADSESDIAPEGFERKPIPFLIVIDRNGKFINLEDTREKIGKIGDSLPNSSSRGMNRKATSELGKLSPIAPFIL